MATKTWQGNGDNWSTPGDWGPTAGVPRSTDDVTIDSGDPLINSNVGSVDSVTTSSSGGLVMNGGQLATTGAFSMVSGVGIDGSSGQGGSTLDVGGALSVAGEGVLFGNNDLAIGNLNLSANTLVEAASISLTSATRLSIEGNESGGPQVSVDISGPAGFGTSGTLTGSVIIQNSTLQFGTGQITTIAPSAALTMGQASILETGTSGNSALDLAQIGNEGALSLGGGETVTSTGSLTNDGTLSIDSTGTSTHQSYTVDGSLTANDPTTNPAFGGIQLSGDASLLVKGNFVNNTVNAINYLDGDSSSAISSMTVEGAATGGGAIALRGASDLEFGAASDNNVAFSAADNTMKLDAPAAGYTGSITGFGNGDTLDLAGEVAAIQSYNGSTLVVQPTAGAAQTFALSGPAANGLQAVPDGSGGTDIVLLCFASGTRIRTVRGEVAVEDLRIGDRAVTASGTQRPIRWIGHRRIDCRAHPRPHEAHPVRIASHAFADNRPVRDLYLSPGHPVLVGGDEDGAGGCLVPIMCLVNGTTVRRVAVDDVTYWHVELDTHDIVLAEGLAAESYLDWGDRTFFSEGADHALANPDFVVPGLGARCRPVAIDGPLVEAERRRLDGVFATRLADACAWPVGTSLDTSVGEALFAFGSQGR